MKRIFKNSKGQTSVEYMLMIVVAISIGVAFWKNADRWFISKPDGLYYKKVTELQGQFGSDSRFKTFRLQRYK